MSMIDTTETERKIDARLDLAAAGAVELSQQSGGVGFSTLGEAMQFAKIMAISGFAIPKHLRGNVGACMSVIIQAVEWKFSPFAVANKSYLVNDRLSYESQLIQAVVLKRAPIKGRFAVTFSGEGEKRTCTVSAVLKDGDGVRYTSPEIGKIPIKNSPLWKNDPDQQLFYYSGRALCRRHFPDVLLGIYTPEDSFEGDAAGRGPEHARDVTPAKERDLVAESSPNRLNAARAAPDTSGNIEPPHDPPPDAEKIVDGFDQHHAQERAIKDAKEKAYAAYEKKTPAHDPETGEIISDEMAERARQQLKQQNEEGAGGA